MGLRTKIAMILIGVLLVLASLTVVVIGWDARRNLDLLERTESMGDLRRLLVTLDAQMLQVDALLGSWANWTSLYEHAEKPDAVFVRDELNVEGIRVAHIDWLFRITPGGEIADTVEIPQADGSLPVTATVREVPERVAAFVSTLADKPEGCGMIQAGKQLAYFCYRPLHDTAGKGAARGTVAIGRWIRPEMIALIREQTDLDFDLVAVDPSEVASESAEAAPGILIDSLVGHGEPVIARSEERLQISFPIIGIGDRHIGELRMDWPRRSVVNARHAMTQTRNTLLMLLVGAAVAIIVLTDRIVVRRLRRMKHELGGIVGDRDWDGSVSDRGRDELGELARYANGLMDVLRAQMKELRELSALDSLTGLANRRSFNARLEHVLSQFARAKRQASLILIDIDHFKRYNDTYGHPAGDAALQQVAACLKAALRRQLDLPARLGGEEFAVVCDETPLSGALNCAEMLRKAVLAQAIVHAGNQPLGMLSISCGVACIDEGDTAASLYERADRALYHAKEAGRNAVSAGI